jgi:hypothetical protein
VQVPSTQAAQALVGRIVELQRDIGHAKRGDLARVVRVAQDERDVKLVLEHGAVCLVAEQCDVEMVGP